MKNFTFKVGTSMKIGTQYFRIIRILENQRVQLEAEMDGALSYTTYDELLEKYEEKILVFSDDQLPLDGMVQASSRALTTFGESVQLRAIRKKQYLDFILNLGPFISTPKLLMPIVEECAKKIGDEKPPCPISVYRWYRDLTRHQRDFRALIDRHDRKGGCGSRLQPEVTEILHQAIDEIFLSEQRNSGDDVYFDVVHRVNKRNEFNSIEDKLRIPSRATVYRALASLDKFDEMSARFGKRIAEMKFRTSGLGVRPTRILERVEIDHTPLDLFVIDDKTGLPLGRPTATFAICAHSRMPVGMNIGFNGTSIEAVFACLRHALIPKTYIKRDYPEIIHDWPCYGHIETLVCDNGLEFHSDELERVAFELGTQIQFCPKRQAYYKGSIERFLQSLNFQFSRALPGHSFEKWFHREDYDPVKNAVITFDQLMRYLHRWLVDIYAQKLHRGINCSPYRRWSDSAKESPPRLISDLNRLDVTLGRTCERTIFHYGIEFQNLRYNDSALLALRRQHGEQVKVEVRYYFDDISLIHVIDPVTKEMIPVPALEQAYAKSLTIEQHRLICARAREINAGIVDLHALARAKAEIREIVTQLSLNKLQHKRQRGAKIRNVGQNKTEMFMLEPTAVRCTSPAQTETSSDIQTNDLPDIGALIFSRLPKTLEVE
jgi:putative transposase